MGDETQHNILNESKKNGGFLYEQKSKESRSDDIVGVAVGHPFGAGYGIGICS